ncbi:putative bifunctional diguanylate cyclase/phosphodiesterase [Microlunatus ginsengisoli]|uniref:EAL domain-containing protein n=1 Tax=Microlunatus ginsengisoli TaxID=363863 RepID=A0ABP7A715_9ACTN
MTETSIARPAAPGGRRPVPTKAWLIFLAAGAVGIAVYYLVPSGLPRDVVYQAFGVASAAGIVVGTRLHRPRRPLPWYLMAAGMLVWSAGDAVASWNADVMGNDDFPSVADPVYLIGYPFVAAGLILLIRSKKLRADTAGVLDSAILTTALGVLSWVLLARPTIVTFQDSVLAAVIAVAYPVADIVLAAILIRMVTTPGGRTPAFRLLVAALALLIVADTAASAFNMLVFDATDQIDWLWLASYALWGAAALHRSMTELTEPDPASDATFSRWRLVALTVAVLVAPGTLAVQQLTGGRLDVWAVVVGSVTIFLLVIARINLSIHQIKAVDAERQQAQLELARQASHDALTGLANRPQAMLLIRGALARAQRSGAIVGLLFVDLDGFKRVNDTLGHRAGDEVLHTTARRMESAVRAGDVVARLGGDEFVVLLEPVVDEPAAVGVAERLVRAIAEPISLTSGRQAGIGASIGVAINSDGGVDPDRLVHEADQAAYLAKANGRGRVEVFAASLRAELARRAAMERGVLDAVRGDEVTLRRDPILDLGDLTVVAAQLEAVLIDPDGGSLARSEVIDVLDGTESMCELDAWVLRLGASPGSDPRPTAGVAADVELVRVVPITARHLSQPRIVDDVRSALAMGVRPGSLMLLVPAVDVLDDLRVLGHLTQLQGLGVSVCMDGFGAGSGATDRWAQLPFDHVRLDERLLGAGVGPILLRLTVETAHAFGYRVLAAQIADEDQLRALREAGCDLGQGPALALDQPGAAGGAPIPPVAVSQRATSPVGTGRDQ